MSNISTAALLNGEIRKKLDADGLLWPAANETDVIWQQMTLENFNCLLTNEQLYFKAYGEFSDYDEMKLHEFVRCQSGELKDRLVSMYDELEKHMFISCWYNSRYLSDVIFKTYAKSDSGIAIGTTVKELEDQLNKNNLSGEIDNIVSGNVQYISQRLLQSEDSPLFDPSQVYAPIFIKGLQFEPDHEFRVCCFRSEPEELIFNSRENVEMRNQFLTTVGKQVRSWSKSSPDFSYKLKFLAIAESMRDQDTENQLLQGSAATYLKVSPENLIHYIAIKDDSIFRDLDADGVKDFFQDTFDISMELSGRSDGFRRFEVMQIGGTTP